MCVSHNLGVSHTSAVMVNGFVLCAVRAEPEETVEHRVCSLWAKRSSSTALYEVWDKAEEIIEHRLYTAT
jgi:hypothetical protein